MASDTLCYLCAIGVPWLLLAGPLWDEPEAWTFLQMWDDGHNFLENSMIVGLTRTNLKRMMTTVSQLTLYVMQYHADRWLSRSSLCCLLHVCRFASMSMSRWPGC